MEPVRTVVDKKIPVKPLKLTKENFEEVINTYDYVLVDGWASWCMPCRMIAPVIDDLAEEMKGQVVFAKLNVDDNQEIASQLGMFSIPNLVLFKNGNAIDRAAGAMPKAMLKNWLSSKIET